MIIFFIITYCFIQYLFVLKMHTVLHETTENTYCTVLPYFMKVLRKNKSYMIKVLTNMNHLAMFRLLPRVDDSEAEMMPCCLAGLPLISTHTHSTNQMNHLIKKK